MAEANATTTGISIQNIDGFDLLNCIATGNVSQVWEVKEVSTGHSYAMKLLLPESFADPEQKNQLKHEARIGKSCDHPNLIKVYDVRSTKKHLYFTMELFRGMNLKSMLRSDLTGVQVRAKKIMEGVTQALAHLHEKGWVHKDVKPENILVTRGGDVRLIDFSLAVRNAGTLSKMLTNKKNVIIQGTRTYIAPELVRRNPATFAVDMYSLGITLYEMLTGKPPFVMSNPDALLMAHIQGRVEPPSQFNPNLTPELDRLVLKMLAKKPKDRPTNMQEAFAEIRSINFFKTDMEEHAKAAAAARADTFKDSMAHRLDSRTDAERTPEQRTTAAAVAKDKIRKIAESQKSAAAKVKDTSRSAPAPAPVAMPQPVPMAPPPMMMPSPFPMAPGFPMPMPGFPMPPAMPMPGFPMPGPIPGAAYPPPMAMPPGMPVPAPAPQQRPLPAAGAPQPVAPAALAASPPAPAAAPPRRKSTKSYRSHDAANDAGRELPDVQ
ncbi:MAG: serine/threonine-protein kinase [Planctomycetaceae bacterium]